MRLLLKRFASIHMIALESEYAFRLLNVLEKMGFPHTIIEKHVQGYVAKLNNMQLKENSKR
jgi:hypothetical protein